MWQFGGKTTIFQAGRVAVRLLVAILSGSLVVLLSELMVGVGVLWWVQYFYFRLVFAPSSEQAEVAVA